MKTQFEQELEDLKRQVVDMASGVNKMIELANRIILNREEFLLEEVYKIEKVINHMEVEIESFCVKLIALHQPAATDLRLIVSVIKMANQLERLGDHAVNIAKRFPGISRISPDFIPQDMKPLALRSSRMFQDVISAFIDQDSEKARKVCEMDDEVDGLNKLVWNNFIQEMIRSHIDLETGFELLLTSRQYERIGDCATNLAEEVVFYLQGKNIKHQFTKNEEDADTEASPILDEKNP
ncbi:phosphate signaling complex protein PhoU [Candidatus Sumerlaeota bacterium]|nr:phosphate signaling complex protein PhoU [Candidatus Sumerlaeota bacterium]